MTININKELLTAKEAATNAGIFLKENKHNLNEILSSTNKDIKLEADIRAEKIIIDYISSKSDIKVLAEESGMSSSKFSKNIWVIDPLDGTANYARGILLLCFNSLDFRFQACARRYL